MLTKEYITGLKHRGNSDIATLTNAQQDVRHCRCFDENSCNN
jgi:hypothetical protein